MESSTIDLTQMGNQIICNSSMGNHSGPTSNFPQFAKRIPQEAMRNGGHQENRRSIFPDDSSIVGGCH